MPKPWDQKPLFWKIFLEGNRVYINAGLIIGHLGTTPIAFYDAAKLLPDWNKLLYENAARDLTLFHFREPPHLKYVLTDYAKKALRIVIGPSPDDPCYRAWWVSRLISVRLEREAGRAVTFATVPPVPLDPPLEEVPPKKRRKK